MTQGKFYACIMLTLWRMNERHDCHARPTPANDQ